MIAPEDRRIVCAAVLFDSGHLIVGPRHYDGTMVTQINQLAVSIGMEVAQGFIDQAGTFFDRADAKIIAERAGQILRRSGCDSEELFSENLY